MKALGTLPVLIPMPGDLQRWIRGSLMVWTLAGKGPIPTGFTKSPGTTPWRLLPPPTFRWS